MQAVWDEVGNHRGVEAVTSVHVPPVEAGGFHADAQDRQVVLGAGLAQAVDEPADAFQIIGEGEAAERVAVGSQEVGGVLLMPDVDAEKQGVGGDGVHLLPAWDGGPKCLGFSRGPGGRRSLAYERSPAR